MKILSHYNIILFFSICATIIFFLPEASISLDKAKENNIALNTTSTSTNNLSSTTENVSISNRYKAIHIYTPKEVRALYLSGWGAGSNVVRDRVVKTITNSQANNTKGLNAIVIDIKDYTGYISFNLDNSMKDMDYDYGNIFEVGNTSKKIDNIYKIIESMHDKNIYVIGRIAVFQDPYMPRHNTDMALKDIYGNMWKDKKSLTWVDPSNRDYWKYIVNLSKYSHDIGFDEINLDYIRYPTDGNINIIKLGLASGTTKYNVINNFYQYVGQELKNYVPLSADLFGLVTASEDDLGIGQKMESGLLNFDFISPMIYPSHYGAGFKGISDPDANPKATIRATMSDAYKKVNVLASSTNKDSKIYWDKMRPWIQDFSLRSVYGIKEVNGQIEALRELGINSYLIWNASNVYTQGVTY